MIFQSVCQSVTVVSPAKTAELIKMLFGLRPLYVVQVSNKMTALHQINIQILYSSLNINLVKGSHLVLYSSRWLGSRVAKALDLQLAGCEFNSQPRRCRVTTLGKLFTPMCLCHQAV